MRIADKRLIYVDEAIEKINGLCVDGNKNWIGTDNQSFVDHADVIDILDTLPTVDAVPVVHGEWIEKPNPWGQDGSHSYDCSICGERTCVLGHKLRYCPHCGAKMSARHTEENNELLS